jgi:hypothetical protein
LEQGRLAPGHAIRRRIRPRRRAVPPGRAAGAGAALVQQTAGFVGVRNNTGDIIN